MTGIVISYAQLPPRSRRRLAQTQAHEKHADVHHALAQHGCPSLLPFAAQHQRVFVHRRAAARRVRDDGVYVSRKCIQVPARKGLGRFEIACVPGQSAATSLAGGHNDLDAIA